jgi:hypothetical protein
VKSIYLAETKQELSEIVDFSPAELDAAEARAISCTAEKEYARTEEDCWPI